MSAEKKGLLYYGDYLELEKVLNSQHPKSDKTGQPAHDEMLFIIVHQAYELWFKQIRHERDFIVSVFKQESVDDNSADMALVVHRLRRIVEIWKLLIQQVGVIETMTSLDFLDFRNLLIGASGFQSFQFRYIEATLGLRMDERHMQHYYKREARFNAGHKEEIDRIENNDSIASSIEKWLERLPFLNNNQYWDSYQPVTNPGATGHKFWDDYRNIYQRSLSEMEDVERKMEGFDLVFFGKGNQKESSRRFSPEAMRGALFISLYRHFPMLQQPFQLINLLLEIDEHMSTWRYKHWIMVRRMIGARIGTGGTSGKDYLKGASDTHHIFRDLEDISTFLIERKGIPALPEDLQSVMGYDMWKGR